MSEDKFVRLMKEGVRARRRGPEAAAEWAGDDPWRLQCLANLEATLAKAPPLSERQRSGIRAVFRGTFPGLPKRGSKP